MSGDEQRTIMLRVGLESQTSRHDADMKRLLGLLDDGFQIVAHERGQVYWELLLYKPQPIEFMVGETRLGIADLIPSKKVVWDKDRFPPLDE